MTTYVDLHIIQTLPPSNVNRDDTGQPKSAIYGGVPRARVSSQAWKRATRAAFPGHVDSSELGYRTKRLVELLGDRILERKGGTAADEPALQDARNRAEEVLGLLGLKLEKPRVKKGEEELPSKVAQAEYLVFISSIQLDKLAELACSTEKLDKKAVKAAMQDGHGVDIALFGRMVANDADLNVDAAVQVAHALSTHRVDNEDDYFTAVDDRNERADTGAGMIGTVEFNSSTLYRFATINVDGLLHNLGDADATGRAAAAFVQGFVTSMPTGKQNTFGNRTLPDAVVVMVREGQPVSLAGAFEDAVTAADTGHVRPSCEQLATYAEEVLPQFSTAASHIWVTRGPAAAEAVDRLGERIPLQQLVDNVRHVVTETAAR
ncbi:CRISPR system Cascade subunit CasC [Austwickia chelonae]|uniref:Putative CRISPR-associated protein n=1 Tax=Austwickia chelonae NBRC 105200 TaxID=1184607 RepID=K6VB01_9MICO|nr:type I-E CRISPR-associated protein Cas7/Cse4/CasC [Austwickia chelonae]GAB79423.1 putative CRISPR-associated protein [Austwickia chelonae NBRC 105200]SEW36925.1 CRISPR system Cascade subunit CasC [Austwickia chelonae]